MGLWNCFLYPPSIPSTPSLDLFVLKQGLVSNLQSPAQPQTAETTAVYNHTQLAALLFLFENGAVYSA